MSIPGRVINPSKSHQPGEVDWWPGTTPPQGALVRDGAAVSRTTYANLFAAIGTIYGVGDGSTTFNLPDDVDEFVRGVDDIGRSVGSTQTDQFQSHRHNYSNSGNQGGSHTGGSQGTNSNTGATGGSETRPQNRGYIPIIWT